MYFGRIWSISWTTTYTTLERYTDWNSTSNKTLESKGDGIKYPVLLAASFVN